jgi:hypothetical protein
LSYGEIINNERPTSEHKRKDKLTERGPASVGLFVLSGQLCRVAFGFARSDYDRSRAGSSRSQKVEDAGSTIGNLVTIVVMAAATAPAASIAAPTVVPSASGKSRWSQAQQDDQCQYPLTTELFHTDIPFKYQNC